MITSQTVAQLVRNRGQMAERVGSRGDGELIVDARGGHPVCRYRYMSPDGKRVTVALGTIAPDGLTLASARTRVRELAALRQTHPALREWLADEAARAARAAEVERQRGTLAELLQDYVADLERRRGEAAAKEPRRLFRVDVVEQHPALATRPAAEIRPRDVAAILRPLLTRDAAVLANHLRAYLSAAFTFGLKHEHDPARDSERGYGLEHNPVDVVPVQREANRAGTRALTADELRELYTGIAGTEGVGPVVAAFLQFLVALGGQRPAQVLRVPWTGYDLEQNTIEIHDSKGRGSRDRVHLVPLSPRALGLLQWVKPITGRLDHPWASLRAKGQPLGLMTIAHTIGRFLAARPELAPFTARDLRRTTKQLALRAGIPLHDVNLLQHHGMTGVAVQHYANSPEAFLPQLREIMARWDAALGRILAGEPVQEPPAAPAKPKRARARAKPKA